MSNINGVMNTLTHPVHNIYYASPSMTILTLSKTYMPVHIYCNMADLVAVEVSAAGLV